MDVEIETYKYGNIFVHKWNYAPKNKEVHIYIN